MTWHTMQVIDEPKERLSSVLNQFGEPITLEHKNKMGFDLTPSKKENNGKTSWETCYSLPQF